MAGAGIIAIHPKPDGPGSTYEPTQAGRELSDVMLALEHWGSVSGPGRRGWLLIERGDAEVCEKYPGGEEDLVVVNEPVAFARWNIGEPEPLAARAIGPGSGSKATA